MVGGDRFAPQPFDAGEFVSWYFGRDTRLDWVERGYLADGSFNYRGVEQPLSEDGEYALEETLNLSDERTVKFHYLENRRSGCLL